MKIWHEHAADHSSNLRIVGRFKDAADAKKAADLLNEVLDIASKGHRIEPGRYYSAEMLEFINRTSFSVSPEAVESAQYHFPVAPQGAQIEVRTDDMLIQVIIEAFIHAGGKVEVYSLHDYP